MYGIEMPESALLANFLGISYWTNEIAVRQHGETRKKTPRN